MIFCVKLCDVRKMACAFCAFGRIQNDISVFFTRNHFISNLVLDSRQFKKLLELHVFIRNHFISNLVLDSLKFKKLLELHKKRYKTFSKIAH